MSAWIFAYGSLIFRPDFSWEERCMARARGFARRFYQGSPDHRGTPAHLGRVVTLVGEPDAACEGVAYRLGEAEAERVFGLLDVRERGGYARASITLELDDSRRVDATTWVAPPDNPHWLGPEPWDAVLARVRTAHGPSGANVDYVLRLRDALRSLDIIDAHVEALARALEESHAERGAPDGWAE